MTTLLLALAIAQPQTITFSHPCAHSSVVLDALGKQLGVTMKPSGSVNQDYFLVHLTDVPKQEALDKIAATLNADWVVKGGVNYLERGARQEEQELIDRTSYLRKKIVDSLASPELDVSGTYGTAEAMQLVSQAQASADTSGANVEYRAKLQATGHYQRFLKQFLRGLGVERIMSPGISKRANYSDRPAQGELQVPADLKPLVSQFYREVAAHHEALARLGVSRFVNGFQGLYLEDPPKRIVVDVSYSYWWVSATLSVDQGEHLLQVAWLTPSFDAPPMGVTVPAGAKFEFDPVGHEIALRLSERHMQSPPQPIAPVSPEARLAIRSMPEFEPLSALYSSALIALASDAGKNVVAVLPDSIITSLRWVQPELSQDLTEFLRRIASVRLAFSEEDRWITARPLHPEYVRANRFPRNAVARFLKAYDLDQRLTLENVSVLADACTDAEGRLTYTKLAMSGLLAGAAIPDAMSDQWSLSGQLLSVYASLPKLSKDAARSDWVSLPVTSLGGPTLNRIGALIGQQGKLVSTAPRTSNHPWWTDAHSINSYSPGPRLGALPGEFPKGTQIAIRVFESDLLEPLPTSQGVYTNSAGSLTQLALMYVSSSQGRTPNLPFDMTQMYILPTERFELRIELPDGRSASFGTDVMSRKFGRVPHAVESLPEPLKTSFLSRVKEFGGMTP